jgi:uncharacterized protein YyaL (SSP411 family)
MLYDQALLAIACLETYQATGKEEYAQTSREIFEYVSRDLTDSGGGFYSAEDADSEGEEGKFYVWSDGEVRELLGESDAELFMKVFGFEEGGNFQDQASGRRTGDNIIHLKRPLSEYAVELELEEQKLASRIEAARKRLFERRERRVRPHKDDKILTDWNGLMISAYAMGGRILNEAKYKDIARKAADFILANLRDSDGGLLHRYRDGESGIRAHLDDYAYLIWGLVELYQADFDIKYLKSALELNDEMLALFWDDDNGALYYSAADSDDLIVRSKEIYDGATPSGNSVAAYNFIRLARITGKTDLERKVGQIGKLFSSEIRRIPSAFTMMLNSVDFGAGPSCEIVISGKYGSEDTEILLNALNSEFIPNKVVVFRPDEKRPEISSLAEYTLNQKPVNGGATVYVCRDFACSHPTTEKEKMLELINQQTISKVI